MPLRPLVSDGSCPIEASGSSSFDQDLLLRFLRFSRRSGERVEMEHKNDEFDLSPKNSADCEVQPVLKLEAYPKIVEDLPTRLKSSEFYRDKCAEEHREAQTRIDALEAENAEIRGRLSEFDKTQEQFLHVVEELKAVREELRQVEAELVDAEESKFAAMRQVASMGAAVDMEKEKTGELLKYISELNEAILSSKLEAIESEKEKYAFFSEMEQELEIATAAALQAEEQLEETKTQSADIINDLKNELLAKNLFIDSLQLELKRAEESSSSSAKAALDANHDLNRLKSEMEMMKSTIPANTSNILSIEDELKRSEEELRSAKVEVGDLNRRVEIMANEMQKVEDETAKTKETKLGLQVEIAMLKSELHKGRSKIAAAEAAEARAKSAQAGLYLAVRQLAVESEEAKNEVRGLKLEAKIGVAVTEIENNEDSSTASEDSGSKRLDTASDSCLLEDANRCEVDAMKEELETVKAAELSNMRLAVAEAVRRAEMAEKAKEAVEDCLRKWREKQQQRRRRRRAAASDALREESSRRQSDVLVSSRKEELRGSSVREKCSTSMCDEKLSNYIPLGKVLNMKF